MKVIVDEIPETPSDCLFSYRNCEYGWICNLKKIRCKDTSLCECLKVGDK